MLKENIDNKKMNEKKMNEKKNIKVDDYGYYWGVGSQDKCHEDNKDCNFYVCAEQKINGGYTNTYSAYKNIEDFLEFYDTIRPQDKCFYEQLTGEIAEMYDIDAYCSNKKYLDEEGNFLSKDYILNNFVHARSEFGKYAEDNLGYVGARVNPDEHFLIKNTPDPSGKKVSFHIIIRNGYKFKDTKQLKTFTNDFSNYISENDIDVDIDRSIYSINRNIRLLGSHKAKQDERIASRYEFNMFSKHAPDSLFCASYLIGDEKYVEGKRFTDELFVKKENDTIVLAGNNELEKLCDLICEKIDDETHSLCDTEYANKLNYDNWKTLVFTFISSTIDDIGKLYPIFCKLHPYYRHQKEDVDLDWIKKKKYRYPSLTCKSLHYWARENDRYEKVFELEIEEYKKKKNIENYKRMLKDSRKDYDIKVVSDFHKLSRGVHSKAKVMKYIRDIVKNISNGGNSFLKVRDRYYCKTYKKNIEVWATTMFSKLTKKGGQMSNLVKTINENYISELEKWEKDPKNMQKPRKIIEYFMGKSEKFRPDGLLQELIENGDLSNYGRIEFNPYLHKPKKENKEVFNSFFPFPFCDVFEDEHKPDLSLYEGSRIRNHIRETLCNDDINVFNYIENWIADMLQRPYQRPDMCILFVGSQGTGKDFFGKFLGLLIGTQNFLVCGNMGNLLKGFNKDQEGKLLTILNEVSDKGVHFDKHDQLKHQITQDQIRIEPKGIDPYHINHVSRYIGFSNKENILKIEGSDRRFFMNKTNNKYANNQVYFNPLWKSLDDLDILKSAFYYYATKNIDDFNPRYFPNTVYKDEQKEINLPIPLSFILDLYRENETEDIVRIHSQDLYTKFISYCSEQGITFIPQRKTVKSILSSFGIKEIGRFRVTNKFNGRNIKRVGYELCREKIEKLFKIYFKKDDFCF